MPLKEANSYIVLQKGGRINGHVVRTKARFRVGAKSEKEAILLCKQTVDRTGSFRVYYREKDRTALRGTVTPDTPAPDPRVLIHNQWYIRTEETKTLKENGIPVIYRKYVKLHGRKASDVYWRNDTIKQHKEELMNNENQYR